MGWQRTGMETTLLRVFHLVVSSILQNLISLLITAPKEKIVLSWMESISRNIIPLSPWALGAISMLILLLALHTIMTCTVGAIIVAIMLWTPSTNHHSLHRICFCSRPSQVIRVMPEVTSSHGAISSEISIENGFRLLWELQSYQFWCSLGTYVQNLKYCGSLIRVVSPCMWSRMPWSYKRTDNNDVT